MVRALSPSAAAKVEPSSRRSRPIWVTVCPAVVRMLLAPVFCGTSPRGSIRIAQLPVAASRRPGMVTPFMARRRAIHGLPAVEDEEVTSISIGVSDGTANAFV